MMTMEQEKSDAVAVGVKQELTGVSVYATGKYYEMSAGMLSGKVERTQNEYVALFQTKLLTTQEDVIGGAFSLFLKYPFYLLKDRITIFPLFGGEYRWFDSD
jgi:hypothetical protein